ncbi:MAG TPA: methyltransferase [Opitutus sp.]|nr:methyltransferase [Opitutus sp.]
MPATIARPTQPRIRIFRPPAVAPLELPSVAFFGRSLEEYTRFFALDLAALRGRAVLDVAGGPASFTAEACRRGVDAVAVDPLYAEGPAALGAQVREDYANMFAQMRAKRPLLKFGPAGFVSLAAAESDRRAAAQRFLADFEAHQAHGRYVSAALPRLPFFDGAFDLVLCAHLLFTYAQRFDFAWHLAACRELVRVSAGEVRIHPLCGLDGRRYPELERLRRELQSADIASKVVRVPYEFFTGTTTMLVLNPEAS